jgi:hypothetical protein
MSEFWKNEWELFKVDVDNAVKFLTQPVTFSKKEDNLFLKPTFEEASQKSEQSGFWKQQWDMFTKEYDSFLNTLMQPVKFK